MFPTSSGSGICGLHGDDRERLAQVTAASWRAGVTPLPPVVFGNQFLTIRARRIGLQVKWRGATMEMLQCGRTLAEVEREYILATLECCHGNRTRTASLLHISIRCLRIKLHDYAQSGCAVCEPHAHLGHFECELAKQPQAPCRRH